MGKQPSIAAAVDRQSLSGVAASLCRLFDHLADVQFWIKDPAGRYVWVNRGFPLNYSLESSDEVIGRTDHDLSHFMR